MEGRGGEGNTDTTRFKGGLANAPNPRQSRRRVSNFQTRPLCITSCPNTGTT